MLSKDFACKEASMTEQTVPNNGAVYRCEQDDISTLSGGNDMPTPPGTTNATGAFLNEGSSGPSNTRTPHVIPFDNNDQSPTKPVPATTQAIGAAQFGIQYLKPGTQHAAAVIDSKMNYKKAAEMLGYQADNLDQESFQYALKTMEVTIKVNTKMDQEARGYAFKDVQKEKDRQAEDKRHKETIAVAKTDDSWLDTLNAARYRCWHTITFVVSIALMVALACDFFSPIFVIAKIWWNAEPVEKLCSWTGDVNDPFFDDSIDWHGRYLGLTDSYYYCYAGNARRIAIFGFWMTVFLAGKLFEFFCGSPKEYITKSADAVLRLIATILPLWWHGLIPAVSLFSLGNCTIVCVGVLVWVFVYFEHRRLRKSMVEKQYPTRQDTNEALLSYEDATFVSYTAMITFVIVRVVWLYMGITKVSVYKQYYNV